MTRPRFLADHDLNEHIVMSAKRYEPTLEFLRVRDLGMSELSDAEILDYASQQSLLVVSHDVNTMPAAAYSRLSAGESFLGLLMVQQSSPIGAIVESIVLIWSASELEEWKDQVVFLPFD